MFLVWLLPGAAKMVESQHQDLNLFRKSWFWKENFNHVQIDVLLAGFLYTCELHISEHTLE